MPEAQTINPKQIEEAVAVAFDAVSQGLSLTQMGQITPEEVEALYALGCNYYAQKNFSKAEEIFIFALPYDCFHAKMVLGLGAARKMQEKFDDALKAYALAGLLELSNPEPSFYAAECFFALKQFDHCRQALDAALALSQDDKALQKKVQKMITTLKEQTQ